MSQPVKAAGRLCTYLFLRAVSGKEKGLLTYLLLDNMRKSIELRDCVARSGLYCTQRLLYEDEDKQRVVRGGGREWKTKEEE